MIFPKALRTKRAVELMEWVAMNDNAGDDEGIDEIAGYLTTTMIAHVYGVPAQRVAEVIYYLRRKGE